MIYGQNVLNISSSITNNSSLLSNLVAFIKQKFPEFPSNCNKMYIIDKRYALVYNSNIGYIIDYNTLNIMKFPFYGNIMHIEIKSIKKGREFNVYYLNNGSIICDDINSYDWDRKSNQEHGVKINRRSFLYNFRENILQIDSTEKYQLLKTQKGQLFLVDKKDIINTLDNKICKTIGQVIQHTDYFPILSDALLVNIDKYLEEGTLISAKLRENDNGTLSLYTMILTEDDNVNRFRVMEHTIDEKTFSVINHKFINQVSVHGCNVCSSRYRVDLIIDVVDFMSRHGYGPVKIVNCDLGPEGDIYVSYKHEDEDSPIVTLYLKYEEKDLVRVFETTLEDQSFILHGVINCNNNDRILIHAEKRQLFDMDTSYNPDECIECVLILIDQDLNIREKINARLSAEELVRIFAGPKTEGFKCQIESFDQETESSISGELNLEQIAANVESFASQANEMLDMQEAQELSESEEETSTSEIIVTSLTESESEVKEEENFFL